MAGLELDPTVAGVQRDQRLTGPAIDRHPVPLRRGEHQVVPVRHPVVFERQIDPLTGLLFVRPTVLPHPRRVLVEAAVPRGFTVGRQVLRHRTFRGGQGSRHHHPFRRFEYLTGGDALRVARALFLDARAGEIVAELPRSRLHLHPGVGDPCVRSATLTGAPDGHPVGGEAGGVVVPTVGQRPRLAELDADCVVAAVAGPIGIGALGEITRRGAVAATLAAGIDVAGVVVTQLPLDHSVGDPPQ